MRNRRDVLAEGRVHKRERALILVAYCLSGVAALIYEVTWTRALALVLGNTVYALSTMLATFMAGLAIGAYIGGRVSRGYGNLLLAFALCELGIGLTGLMSIPVLYRLPYLYLYIFKYFHGFPTLFFIFEIFMCANVMIVPTALMGATFPIVCTRITQTIERVGAETGRAYGINTAGAVAGSFAGGFFFIPAAGVNGAAIAAACANAAVAFVMLALSGRRALLSLLIPLPLLMLIADWRPSVVNFYTMRHLSPGATHDVLDRIEKTLLREVFYEEHPEGLVRAFRDMKSGELVLQVDGKIEGTGTGDLPNTLLLAYLPLAAHPGPTNFLTIGLGAGVTLAAAREHVGETDLIEINPGVIKAVRLYGPPGLLEGVKIFVNDARNHLFRSNKQYDIISSQPSIPTESPVASLFSREFFESAASRLRPGGILCQALPYYLLKEDDLYMMLKTFGSVFPFAAAWKVEGSNDVIMLGSMEPLKFGPGEISLRVASLNRSGLALKYSLFATPAHIGQMAANPRIPLNTDDRPRLEFRVVRNILTAPHGEKE